MQIVFCLNSYYLWGTCAFFAQVELKGLFLLQLVRISYILPLLNGKQGVFFLKKCYFNM